MSTLTRVRLLPCNRSLWFAASVVAAFGWANWTTAANWTRFRGPNGSGVTAGDAAAPVTWSDAENLKRSVDLPGLGVSSPIVVGNRVLVTCWTGTGSDDLKRHLVCYDRETGKQLWAKEFAPTAQEEPFEGMFRQTGYTASSPASDGEQIFCFFGVSGVYALDMEGNERWHTSVGTGFDEHRWGTASSPVIWGDLVIVTAASESNAIIALKKSNGEQAWKFESQQLDGTWSTPVVVDLADGRQELAFSVPGFIWGFDPATGKQNWTCKGSESNSACGSPIAHDGVVYAIGGREGGGIAVRAGGSGDVTETHVVWTGNQRARIGTPVYQEGLIYWVADGIANCITADTGEKVYQERLKTPEAVARSGSDFHFVSQQTPVADSPAAEPPAATTPAGAEPPAATRNEGDTNRDRDRGFRGPGRGRGGRGRGGRGGGDWFRSQDYSSPVVTDGKMYFTRRAGEVHVIRMGREFDQLAVNKVAGEADYSATPAISEGDIFIRSSKKLFCVGKQN